MPQDHSAAQVININTSVNENWLEALDEYGVQFLVLDRCSDGDLLKLFLSQPGWTVDFEDEEAVLFVRADIAQFTN